MNIVKKILIIFISISMILGLFLFFVNLYDYKPDEVIVLPINNNQVKTLSLEKPLIITTYNIGYAGLDDRQDFFADGGKNSRASSMEQVIINLRGIVKNIDTINPDFLLLQEVDINSTRTFNGDQLEYFYNKFPNYGYTYGLNYYVPWVPVPIFNPMGKVKSGIVTFSKYNATESYRYDLPGKENWPIQLFELDRCFTETRYLIEGNKELVVINLHLSAFDEGGLIRQQQLKYLKDYLKEEYTKGSYIIVGGDWNHNLPGTDPFSFAHEEDWPFWLKNLPDDFKVDGFNWAVQPNIPTVRTLAKEYIRNYNFLAVIDGFLVSDNIDVVDVFTTDDKFIHSDHNPVTMTFILK